MSKKNERFSDNEILEIIVTTFVAVVLIFLFVKILFF